MEPSGSKILVVDDESGILLLCQHLLEAAPYQVLTCTDPDEALQIIEREEIDLLLTDIRLPSMDGFELISRSKALQPDLAVVVMTGYRTVETAIKALRSGVEGLVIKPFELGSELRDIVSLALQKSQEKHQTVNLNHAQPVLNLGATALLEANVRGLEKSVVPAMAEMLQVQHAAFYVIPAGRSMLQLLDRIGEIPQAGDPFWQIEAAAGLLSDKQGGYQVLHSLNLPEGEVLRERGWEQIFLLVYPRRKDRYVFFAARQPGKPVFATSDRALMQAFAKQTAVTFENVRVFSQLAGIAQKVERSDGILQMAERMAVIEQVVPSLAHDMNNPLQSIKNSLYMASRPENRGDKANYYLSLAQKELYRLEGTVHQVMGLTQPLCKDLVPVDVEVLVKKVLDTLYARLRESGVQVLTAFARPVPQLTGSRDLLELVLHNLILNSLDAMSAVPADKKLWIDAACEGDQLVLTVEDSGPGISGEALASLFKPFYTTKTNGSGCGLVVSQRIMEEQGGQLRNITPAKGSGACMEIRLPCAPKAA